MTYEEALEYIHGINWCFCKPGLERITELCHRLGDPQKSLRFIHVAGTNGKGSFCSMLESVLRHSGYRTGLYTSPYIRYFNERMCVDGAPISNEELAEITEYVRPIADSMTDRPTEFELITAVAFEYFKRKECEVVVLEAGMGGRLDSTNVISSPLLSVITGIALDHMAFLGDTVEKIAAEKAGIIKDRRPVLFGGEDEGAASVIARRACEMGSEFSRVDYSRLEGVVSDLSGSRFDFDTHKDIKIKLLGLYQPKNASLVLSAVDILRREGLSLPEETVKSGLEAALWAGRFEIINREPLTIFDGAHNAQGIEAAVRSIRHYFGNEKVYVFTGVLKDKDYEYIAKELSTVADRAFVITPDSPRALDAEDYAQLLGSLGVEAKPFPSIAEAFAEARKAAAAAKRPLVCLGSLYTYVDIIKLV